MKLTKDEARILSEVLSEGKYEMVKDYNNFNFMEKLEDLQNKLYEFGKDRRRTGRTSQNDWYDLVTRFTNH